MVDVRDHVIDRRLARALDELTERLESLSNAEQASAAMHARTLELCQEVRQAAALSRRILDIAQAARGPNHKHAARQSTGAAAARPAQGSPPPGLPAARLRRVMSYIDSSLAERLTVRRLAAIAGMSPSHFAALFKRSTGVTPHEAVLQRRMVRAKQLLDDRALTVADIGCQLGFSSQAHFTTMFRRRVGVTPSAWRQGRRAGRAASHNRAGRRKISADNASRPAESESQTRPDARQ